MAIVIDIGCYLYRIDLMNVPRAKQNYRQFCDKKNVINARHCVVY